MSAFLWPQRWDRIGDLQREMSRLFDWLEPSPSLRVARPYPSINLYETDGGYHLAAELPGLAPEDLDLAITGDTLTLKGERRRADGAADESFRRQERVFGRWSRTVTLPVGIDGSKVTARFQNGVLTVDLPKSEAVRPRSISVEVQA
jgi:HSP20 family protein